MNINQKMLAVLKGLVENCSGVEHDGDICSRTSECDDAVEDCSYCCDTCDSCPECDCGATQIHKAILRAIQIINEASQSS